LKPGQPSNLTSSKWCQLLRKRLYAGRIRQMSCCEAGCPGKQGLPVGHGDLPLRVLRGVSAMRETCPAIGAGAEMECSINEFALAFVIGGRFRAQPDGCACRAPGRSRGAPYARA
jgi:hypothetical protein